MWKGSENSESISAAEEDHEMPKSSGTTTLTHLDFYFTKQNLLHFLDDGVGLEDWCHPHAWTLKMKLVSLA